MKTFTQMKQEAADNCGLYVDSPEMNKVIGDIRTGVKIIQGAAKRYWSRREKHTKLEANQQFYQLSSDMLRVSGVKVLSGSHYVPLAEISGEDEWNRLNAGPIGLGTPSHFFVKGADEIGLYPTPSADVVKGLQVSYEPRASNMWLEDIKGKAKLTENSTIVELAGDETISPKYIDNCWLSTTDGSDGNWYQVAKVIDNKTIHLDNNYQGVSGDEIDVIIGQCPPFPEEYHDAPIHYACHLFYMLRKDLESANMYKQLYDQALENYKITYGNKTSGIVINPNRNHARADSRVFPGIIIG